MNKIIAVFDRLIRGVIISATAGIMGIICLQIFCRFILNNALSWPEEAARFLMVWALFLAAVYALRYREHVGLNFFVDRLPAGLSTGLAILLHLFIIGFLGVMVVGGWQEAIGLMSLKTGALRMSRAIPYFIIPTSGVLFILVSIRLIIEDFETWRAK
ncbi:TRAP transporter small permease [Desulfobacula sp.]|uniref:TRAP transporter small permease n=1 Tax=Desulfobacula sp. TaxID=2593537 RepID=UPI002625632A|nr:TRAP transporter small permease [Desulfobacula sp.]